MSKKVLKNGEKLAKMSVEKVLENHAKFGRKMARKSARKMTKNGAKKCQKNDEKQVEKSATKSTEKCYEKSQRISRHDDGCTNSSDEEDRTARNDELKGGEGSPKGSSCELKGTKATDHEEQQW